MNRAASIKLDRLPVAQMGVNTHLPSAHEPPQTRVFDQRTGILRFTVPLGHERVTAYLSNLTWTARFGPGNSDASLLELYLQNRPMIDAAVASKSVAGARNPVVLMAQDL